SAGRVDLLNGQVGANVHARGDRRAGAVSVGFVADLDRRTGGRSALLLSWGSPRGRAGRGWRCAGQRTAGGGPGCRQDDRRRGSESIQGSSHGSVVKPPQLPIRRWYVTRDLNAQFPSVNVGDVASGVAPPPQLLALERG